MFDLKSHGYGFSFAEKLNQVQPSPAQRELIQALVQQQEDLTHCTVSHYNYDDWRAANSVQDALAGLAVLAQEAENSGSLSAEIHRGFSGIHILDTLLQEFEKAQILRREGDTVHFASPVERDFVKGGWLEYHTLQAIEEIAGVLGVPDTSIGLKVADAAPAQSGLNIAFMAHDRLYVVECRAVSCTPSYQQYHEMKHLFGYGGPLTGGAPPAFVRGKMDELLGNTGPLAFPRASDILSKLAENCHSGCLDARGMLVCYRRLDEAERRLANALGIELVCGHDIARLPELLKQWLAIGDEE